MKKHLTLAAVSLVVLISFAGAARAEVKNVQMKIAGYLCGN